MENYWSLSGCTEFRHALLNSDLGRYMQEPISVTGRLQSIVMIRGLGRGLQGRADSNHAPDQGVRHPAAGLREESHHFFGPNSSDNTLPVLIDMGFHK